MSVLSRFTFVVLAALLVAACGDDTANEQQMQAAQQQGVPVDVAPVIAQRITEWDSFTGRLESPKTVSLRPRVSGYIDMVAFEEGEYVEQGDTLFLIDNRQFKAEVDRLQAQLDAAKSRLALAKQDLQRAEGLRQSQSISKEILDTRTSEVEQANASVSQTEAALELARLNRGFARVEAPISGRVSRANITEGNYVTAGQTILTSIVSMDRLYAYFDIDETTWLNYQKAQQRSDAVAAQPVAMRLANESDYEHWGKINFVDNQVNSSTGTLRVRAVFDNQNHALLPGLFAHLKLAGGQAHEGILVAEKAIGTDLSNKYVLVLNQENKVEYRAIKMGDKVGSMRIIKDGLKPQDTIVVNGLQRVRPGALVAPNKVSMADEETLNELQAWQQRVDTVNEFANTAGAATTAGL